MEKASTRYLLMMPVTEIDHTIGPGDARTTLVEYADFECPHSRKAYKTIKKIIGKYEDDLCFVFRHFPLVDVHMHALRAAEAAEVAAVYHRFWEMHDRMFEHQDALDDESLVYFAESIGANSTELQVALRTARYVPRIERDLRSGIESHVGRTPTFFINGEMYVDSYEFDALSKAIEKRF